MLLSSVMTWVNTPPKFEEEVKEGEEGEEEAGEAEPAEETEEEAPSDEEAKEGDEEGEEAEPELDENGEPIVVKQPIFFKETDYHLRVPH